MRNTFAKLATDVGAIDKDLLLLSGDIGNRLFDDLKKVAPDQVINCGVAEANMTGVAAGLALLGHKVLTYTITTFNTARVYEQIKLDIAYPNLPVVIVGTGSGLAYAALGVTHQSIDDTGLMRMIPRMTVVAPADSDELIQLFPQVLDCAGPCYLRLGKKGEPAITAKYGLSGKNGAVIGKLNPLKSGGRICVIGVGSILSECEKAALLLERSLKETVGLVSMHTLTPLDYDGIEDLLSAYEKVVIVEEQYQTGSIAGSIIFELQRRKCKCLSSLSFVNIELEFLVGSGGLSNARTLGGISAEAIEQNVLGLL